jgi:hypothetical protein
MEETIKTLLEWGFKEFPARKKAIKSFGLNYCHHCKNGDVVVDLNDDDWFYFETPGMSGSYEFSEINDFIEELKDYGLIHKKSKKTKL